MRTDMQPRGTSHCFVCTTPSLRARTVPEGGVTANSLHNVHVLFAKRGRPTILELRYDVEEWCVVDATFRDGSSYHFTGFSWGYGGEGPHGLAQFFAFCGLSEVSLDVIARWSQDFRMTYYPAAETTVRA